MVPLTPDAWKSLTHAYGSAENIPALLLALPHYPRCEKYDDEPWYTLWSSLCHQQDICDAAIAAIPHILMIAEAAPWRIDHNYLSLPACIEICRRRDDLEFDSVLLAPYLKSLAKIPSIVHATKENEWNDGFCRAACAALAVAKGQWEYANVIIELDPETRREYED
jgi:hypothetical protein